MIFTNSYEPIKDPCPASSIDDITTTTNKKNRRSFGRGEILVLITILLSFVGVATYVINCQTSSSLSVGQMELVSVDGMNEVVRPVQYRPRDRIEHQIFDNLTGRRYIYVEGNIGRSRNANTAGQISVSLRVTLERSTTGWERACPGSINRTFNANVVGVFVANRCDIGIGGRTVTTRFTIKGNRVSVDSILEDPTRPNQPVFDFGFFVIVP